MFFVAFITSHSYVICEIMRLNSTSSRNIALIVLAVFLLAVIAAVIWMAVAYHINHDVITISVNVGAGTIGLILGFMFSIYWDNPAGASE